MARSYGAEELTLEGMNCFVVKETQEEGTEPYEKVFSNTLLMESILSHCQDLPPLSPYRLRLVSSHFNEGVLSYQTQTPPYLKLHDMLKSEGNVQKRKWMYHLPFVSKWMGQKMGGVDFDLTDLDPRLCRGLAMDFEEFVSMDIMTQSLTLYGSHVSHLKLRNLENQNILRALQALREFCPNLQHLQLTLIPGAFLSTEQTLNEGGKLPKLESLNISVVNKNNIGTTTNDMDLRILGDFMISLSNLKNLSTSGIEVNHELLTRIPNGVTLDFELEGWSQFERERFSFPYHKNLRKYSISLMIPTQRSFLTIFEDMVSLQTLHLHFPRQKTIQSFFLALSKQLLYEGRKCETVRELELSFTNSNNRQCYDPDTMTTLNEMFPNLRRIHLDLFLSSGPGEDLERDLRGTFAQFHLWEGLKELEIRFKEKSLSFLHLTELFFAAGEGLFNHGLEKLVLIGPRYLEWEEFDIVGDEFEFLCHCLLRTKEMKVVKLDHVMFPKASCVKDELCRFIEDNCLPVSFLGC